MVSAKNSFELNLVRAGANQAKIAKHELTSEQLQVINHRSSQLLVLGAAGSGKTSTLIAAISNRISQGFDPNSILAITYGRDAASKLRDQIASANPALHTVAEPIARTFHSLAFMILNDPINLEGSNEKNMFYFQGPSKMPRSDNY